jgi:hypothetical protein
LDEPSFEGPHDLTVDPFAATQPYTQSSSSSSNFVNGNRESFPPFDQTVNCTSSLFTKIYSIQDEIKSLPEIKKKLWSYFFFFLEEL